MKQIIKFLKEEDGATAIEYALIAGLVAVALIATLTALGTGIGAFFTSITTKLGTLAAT